MANRQTKQKMKNKNHMLNNIYRRWPDRCVCTVLRVVRISILIWVFFVFFLFCCETHCITVCFFCCCCTYLPLVIYINGTHIWIYCNRKTYAHNLQNRTEQKISIADVYIHFQSVLFCSLFLLRAPSIFSLELNDSVYDKSDRQLICSAFRLIIWLAKKKKKNQKWEKRMIPYICIECYSEVMSWLGSAWLDLTWLDLTWLTCHLLFVRRVQTDHLRSFFSMEFADHHLWICPISSVPFIGHSLL